ncbi:MAG: hypothetical protein HJJLKODD_01944 [Phycisphaerae bacterium]|nr:hypothetical protein [Phycisphaerae bacterium]
MDRFGRQQIAGSRQLVRGMRPQAPRRAFTMIEILVSVALLLLILGMASTVFRITLDGSGTLNQQNELDRSFRMFKNQLGIELANIDPTRSVLAIAANPTPAYWTQEQKDQDSDSNPALPAPNGIFTGIDRQDYIPDPERSNPTLGYDPLDDSTAGSYVAGDGNFDGDPDDDLYPSLPRADILMFVTNLPEARSFVTPEIKSDGPVMIVYNHAELGKLRPSTGPGDNNVYLSDPAGRPPAQAIAGQYDNDSTDDWDVLPRPIPRLQPGQAMDATPNVQDIAQFWHLTRRQILLKSSYDPMEDLVLVPPPNGPRDRFAHLLSPTNPLGNQNYQNGTYTDDLILPPGFTDRNEIHYLNWVLGGEMDVVSPTKVGDSSNWLIGAGLQEFVFEYEISQRYFGGPVGTLDLLAFDSVTNGTGLPPADGLRDPDVADGQITTHTGTLNPGFWRGGLPAYWLARSQLDPEPPASVSHRRGHFFLPNCASFKVEWTPNDIRLEQAGLPEVLWIDPYKEPNGAVLSWPTDPVTNNTYPNPLHLDEFNIMAHVMTPSTFATPDDGLQLGPILGGSGDAHPIFGSDSPTLDPIVSNDLINSKLDQVYQSLVPRFANNLDGTTKPANWPAAGVPFGPNGRNQMNTLDTDNDPTNNPAGTVTASYNTHCWFSRNLAIDGAGNPQTLNEPDPLWPKALRITIDMFDDAGTFQTPVRYVFVLPVGPTTDRKGKSE